MTHLHRSGITGLATLLFLAACGSGEEKAPAEKPTFKFPLQVTVNSAAQAPIPGVPVLLMLNGMDSDAKTIGYTDKDGKFEALIDAHHDTPVAVSLTPPHGYAFASGKDILDDVLTAKIDDKDPTLVHTNTLILNATYASKDVDHLVWVKLQCPEPDGQTLCKDVPIKLGDEIVTTTDMEGRAHFVISDVPNKTVRVTIDTTIAISDEDVLQLEPIDPGFNLTLPSSPQVFTINEILTLPAEVEEEEKTAKKSRPARSASKKASKKSTKKASAAKSSFSFGETKKTPPPKKTAKKPVEKKEDKPKSNSNGISLF